MSVSDPIADALTIIRNGIRANKENVDILFSKLLEQIVKVFKEEGYIKDYKKTDYKNQGKIRVYLKYLPNKESVVTKIQRVSKPSLRVYSGKKELKPVLAGMGIAVVTTSKGIMSDKKAKRAGLGGEVICKIW
ncbi:MAG: 30S ribosomal protein S8 [Candidatus Omnitrophica bacterium]|nr:30S ribosomal protein S8 [Candidatus Omnitrophota bacterium]